MPSENLLISDGIELAMLHIKAAVQSEVNCWAFTSKPPSAMPGLEAYEWLAEQLHWEWNKKAPT